MTRCLVRRDTAGPAHHARNLGPLGVHLCTQPSFGTQCTVSVTVHKIFQKNKKNKKKKSNQIKSFKMKFSKIKFLLLKKNDLIY